MNGGPAANLILLAVMDNVSRAVKAQYEQHPYPAWKNLLAWPKNDLDLDVLFAGCGTGQDILIDAYASPRSRFLGIDLSDASLRHAAFKAHEFGITNVRLKLHNILDVASIGETFDFIKSTGVLHHMADPLAGLVALKSVLRPGGSIKFSVYSKAARGPVLEAIALRKRLNIPPTDDGISRFREILAALPDDNPAKAVIRSPDFESIAGTRDLLFHVQEHNFEIPELVEMVERAGLRIRQWGPSYAVAQFKAMGFADTLDPRAWQQAESLCPRLFAGSMYSLTVSPLWEG